MRFVVVMIQYASCEENVTAPSNETMLSTPVSPTGVDATTDSGTQSPPSGAQVNNCTQHVYRPILTIYKNCRRWGGQESNTLLVFGLTSIADLSGGSRLFTRAGVQSI